MGNAHAAGMAQGVSGDCDLPAPNADAAISAPRQRSHVQSPGGGRMAGCGPGASLTATLQRSPDVEGARRRRLDLSGRSASIALPEAYVADEGVGEVLLANNGLRELPGDVAARWPRLSRLGVGSNAISRVSPGLGRLAETLVWLDMTHNSISALPEDVGDLRSLVSLGASDCRLAEFPIALTRLVNLRKLGVFNNLLRTLPPQIGDMAGLCKLDLSGNQLAALPAEIGNLDGLTWLNLTGNRLTSLPASMGRLTRLRELGLANNALESLPDLSACAQLSLLTLFNNRLTSLPSWTAALPSLAKLDASGNEIRTLPADILAAPSLDLLNVRSNKIERIPARINQSPQKLATLDVRDNRIDVLPIAILGPALCALRVDGNPLRLREHALRGALLASRDRPRPPSLAQAAGSLVLSAASGQPEILAALAARAPPAVRALAAECLVPRTPSRVCAHCCAVFLHPPVSLLETRAATDAQDVPFAAEVCSVRCARARRLADGPIAAQETRAPSPLSALLTGGWTHPVAFVPFGADAPRSPLPEPALTVASFALAPQRTVLQPVTL